MTIPQVEFKIKNPEETLKEINNLATEEIEIVLNEHPKLKKLMTRAQSEEDIIKAVNRYFRQFQKEIKGKMQAIIHTFQKTWNSTNEEFMINTFDLLEINKENYPKFTVNLSYSPIEITNLEKNEFDIYNIGNKDVKKMRQIVSDKILSILLEKKLSDLNIKSELLKELVTTPITGDAKIQKAFTHKPLPREQFKMILIGENFLQNHINNLYKEKTSLEDFLKKSFKFVKENEKKIMEQLE